MVFFPDFLLSHSYVRVRIKWFPISVSRYLLIMSDVSSSVDLFSFKLFCIF